MAAREPDLGRGETPEVDTRSIVRAVLLIFGTLVLVAFGLTAFFSDRIGMTFVDRHALPAPGVEPHEDQQRLALEAQQRAALDGAGGRMPIDAAMAAIAARGPHAFDPLGTPP